MVLNFSNSSNLEQLALKGLNIDSQTEMRSLAIVATARRWCGLNHRSTHPIERVQYHAGLDGTKWCVDDRKDDDMQHTRMTVIFRIPTDGEDAGCQDFAVRLATCLNRPSLRVRTMALISCIVYRTGDWHWIQSHSV